VETGVSVLAALYEALPATEQKSFFRKGLDLMAGTHLLQSSLESQLGAAAIQDLWQAEVEAFRRSRERYLLYGP
jgi:uncharacterized protein YbbC (DUF1343 family)